MSLPLPPEVELADAHDAARYPHLYSAEERRDARSVLIRYGMHGSGYRHREALAAAESLKAYNEEHAK